MANRCLAKIKMNKIKLKSRGWSSGSADATDIGSDDSPDTVHNSKDPLSITNTQSSVDQTQEETVLVVSLGNSVAGDYTDYVRGNVHSGDNTVILSTSGPAPDIPAISQHDVRSMVIFLKDRMTPADYGDLERSLKLADECGVRFICIVSTFSVHLGDRHAQQNEAEALDMLHSPGAGVVVFRPGHILSRNSRLQMYLRRIGYCYPLIPKRWRTCFAGGEELFSAIECERRSALTSRKTSATASARVYTLLGPNESWKDLLYRHRGRELGQAFLTALCRILSLLLVGAIIGFVFDLLARLWPSLQRWNFDTLRPNSIPELLALYNRYNHRYVKVVGYNNGVVHFGHSYPGKTVISTVFCNRIRRAGNDLIKTDCGTTIRHALDFLAESSQELPVIPNYSYVCLGTAFFVPIHGSASDYSTVADTITRVVLYDPVGDRFLAASRHEPTFGEYLYNLKAEILLVRLYLQGKPKSRYFVHRRDVNNPSSREILDTLQDRHAANVEIRKARAASEQVTIYQYYKAPEETDFPVIELPRDRLGRLWDRLEENRVTSFLMHALTRYCAWHVELFFTLEEFPRFWESHRKLPIRKLQLRYIRRDGFPHSPFRESDCVPVDMFMLRWHRLPFERYLKRTFVSVQTNPGKHSR